MKKLIILKENNKLIIFLNYNKNKIKYLKKLVKRHFINKNILRKKIVNVCFEFKKKVCRLNLQGSYYNKVNAVALEKCATLWVAET